MQYIIVVPTNMLDDPKNIPVYHPSTGGDNGTTPYSPPISSLKTDF